MRARFPVTVHLFFLRNDQVLLSRRYNTGYEDGKYSVPAGHVELGESLLQTARREAWEETGVRLLPQDIQWVHVMQRKEEEARVDFFAIVDTWQGEIRNMEPDKCDDLRWCSFDELPENTIPYVRQALKHYRNGVTFSLFGWGDRHSD